MMLAQMGIGAIQTGISAAKAANLPEPQKFTAGPEQTQAFGEARARRNEGYSLAETKNFEQILARQATASKQMFRNLGMSGAGAAASGIMSIDAMNDFAARGAQIRRDNFGQYLDAAKGMQDIRNMETNRFNQQLMAESQALGGGIQAGISNMFQGLNTGQDVNYMNKAAEMYSNAGQTPMFNGFGSNLMGNQQPTGFSNASLMSGSATAAQAAPAWGGFGSGMFGNQQQTGFGQASLPNNFQFYNLQGQ